MLVAATFQGAGTPPSLRPLRRGRHGPPVPAPQGDFISVRITPLPYFAAVVPLGSQAAAAYPQLSQLVSATVRAGLNGTLDGKPHITVFAPNDQAFQKVTVSQLSSLLGNQGQLKKVLNYHIVDPRRTSSAATSRPPRHHLRHRRSSAAPVLTPSSRSRRGVAVSNLAPGMCSSSRSSRPSTTDALSGRPMQRSRPGRKPSVRRSLPRTVMASVSAMVPGPTPGRRAVIVFTKDSGRSGATGVFYNSPAFRSTSSMSSTAPWTGSPRPRSSTETPCG
ncbi:fasciclin domain-containing protein [Streptomyces naganishii]|uniref:fasciclin domain-containing protein n=1 Tax=Streptomyces naganishii TaxID=285447 RepID=UPI003687D080